jgi:hypothetical protein
VIIATMRSALSGQYQDEDWDVGITGGTVR